MNETTEQYKERILGYQRDKKPMSILQSTPIKIGKALKKVTASALKKPMAPGKWSVGEVLAHLADAEIVFGFRLRLVLGSNGVAIQAFDQDIWAKEFHYSKQKPLDSFETFKTMRNSNVQLLKWLSPERWEYFGMHEERGRETVRRMMEMYAGHDINHVMQIEGMVKGRRK